MSDSVTLNHDIPCIGCGYNLRTLPVDSRCPECGTTVVASLVPRPLAHVGRHVLRLNALGLILAILAALLAAIAGLGISETPWVALIALFPGGNKGWLLLFLSMENRSPPWLGTVVIISFSAHGLSSFILTSNRLRLPKATAVRRVYRYISLISLSVVVASWYLHSELLLIVGIGFGGLCDIAQMNLFAGCVSSIAIAGTFSDIDVGLGHAIVILLLVMTLGMLCLLAAPVIYGLIVAVYLIAVYLAWRAVIHLAVRLYKIQPRLGD